MIFRREHAAEGIEVAGEDVDSASIERRQVLFAADQMQRRPALAAGLSEDQGAIREVERGQILAAAQLGFARAPMQPPGNHQVQHDPEIIFETNGNALADSAQPDDRAALRTAKRRCDRAQQKRTRQAARSSGWPTIRGSSALI